ncbi:winged helix-turn-helix domain-containing protein [Nocardia brevicatena]|uniref:winged helix-turn-helix domain-containing protein n=1 Tax=Nocardia brevicatena TaxID=37327 RepID=UPI001C3F370D|nr:winged helix-turn-helix domain-containing protein [Nocardia brevicatena]
MTAERGEFRERLRCAAMEAFARGEGNAVIAEDLRVTARSVQRCRKAWRAGGEAASRSKGPVSRPLLSDEQFAVLEQLLAEGPRAHGWPNQTWTLARIATLIGRRFHISYTLKGVQLLLHRHGWSRQVPARRAAERDPDVVANWVKVQWPRVKRQRRRRTGGWSSKTIPGSR